MSNLRAVPPLDDFDAAAADAINVVADGNTDGYAVLSGRMRLAANLIEGVNKLFCFYAPARVAWSPEELRDKADQIDKPIPGIES